MEDDKKNSSEAKDDESKVNLPEQAVEEFDRQEDCGTSRVRSELSEVPLKSSGVCREPAEECSVSSAQVESNTKKTPRHPETDDITCATDELPVKRVRFDKSVEDEQSTTKITKKCAEDVPVAAVVEQSCASGNLGKTSKSKVKSSSIVHKVKWMELQGKHMPVVTQNENGPCPLIAIVNILLFRKKVNLSEGTAEISAEELVEYVRQAILKTIPKDSDTSNPNHIQNVQDAIAVLPQLQTGLDVNVKFTGVKNFEYTPECIIFDLLDIHLYHGWLLDPQSAEVVAAVGNSSYNQLVEMIINKKSSKDPMQQCEAEIAEQFLEGTATQLTCHGLCELNAAMSNGEMAVLFRNNHFSVLHKNKDILCQLVTDQGFLDERRVVWETLSTIYGDETFLDGNFRSLLPKAPGATYSSLHVIEEQQISQDFLVALSLQDEQNKQQDKEFGWDAYGNDLGAIGMTINEELARRLYIEEQRMAQVSVSSSRINLNLPAEGAAPDSRQTTPVSSQQPGEQPSPPVSKVNEECSKSKEWKCTIA